jgi:hypothetical protein
VARARVPDRRRARARRRPAGPRLQRRARTDAGDARRNVRRLVEHVHERTSL